MRFNIRANFQQSTSGIVEFEQFRILILFCAKAYRNCQNEAVWQRLQG
jgi:hypothetical protein